MHRVSGMPSQRVVASDGLLFDGSLPQYTLGPGLGLRHELTERVFRHKLGPECVDAAISEHVRVEATWDNLDKVRLLWDAMLPHKYPKGWIADFTK